MVTMGFGRQLLFVKAVAVLAALWAVVMVVMKISADHKPTPEKVAAYVDENRLADIGDADKRREVIGKVATMLNQMEPEQLRRFAEEGGEPGEAAGEERFRREFFETMTPDEQRFFMEKRVGKAFEQMMVAFNDMDRDERRRIVQRTLRQMRDNEGDGLELRRLEEADPEMAEKIVNEGLKAYYQGANAETKLDLAPVMEEMQRNLGMRRRGPPPR